MSPITHLFISWSAASCFKIDKKDRILATIAGVVPDIDGIGIGYDLLMKGNGHVLDLWSRYHHTLGHNIGFGLLLTITAFLAAGRRWVTSGLVLLVFHIHLHLFCDVIGSRGPDGYQWPIPYLEPFSDQEHTMNPKKKTRPWSGALSKERMKTQQSDMVKRLSIKKVRQQQFSMNAVAVRACALKGPFGPGTIQVVGCDPHHLARIIVYRKGRICFFFNTKNTPASPWCQYIRPHRASAVKLWGF